MVDRLPRWPTDTTLVDWLLRWSIDYYDGLLTTTMSYGHHVDRLITTMVEQLLRRPIDRLPWWLTNYNDDQPTTGWSIAQKLDLPLYSFHILVQLHRLLTLLRFYKSRYKMEFFNLNIASTSILLDDIMFSAESELKRRIWEGKNRLFLMFPSLFVLHFITDAMRYK